MILLFFDPDKPGTTGETLQVLTNSLVGLDHKLHIILNKADQFRKIHDFARAYGSLCWNLSKVIQRKDLPRIYTMCLPPSFHPVASGDQSLDHDGVQSLGKGIIDLEATREEVVREVCNAPKRRVDNEISRLSDNISMLQMHCNVLHDLTSTYKKAVWKSRFTAVGSILATGSVSGGAMYLEAPMQLIVGTGISGALATAVVLWWNQSSLQDLSSRLTSLESMEKAFQKKYHRQIADKDEFTLSLWARVKDHLKVGLSSEDLIEMNKLASADSDKLDNLIENQIPSLRREAQPSFNR